MMALGPISWVYLTIIGPIRLSPRGGSMLRDRPLIILFICCLGLVLRPQASWSKGKGNPLLVCLGNEEERLHLAKVTGPIYRLNQLFINEFASANEIQLEERYLQAVCSARHFSPSVNLLRFLMLDGKKIFKMNGLNINQVGVAEDLAERAAYIFFNYLAGLQSQTPHPQCLNKKIPEIAIFAERFRYLESDQSAREILSDRKKVAGIFAKLKHFDTIIKSCQKELQAKTSAPSTSSKAQP